MSLQAGQTIGRYRLVEPLGEGGMGVVWRAEDPDLQRRAALKFLNEGSIGGEEMEARFLREARMAASLNHPGICTIYEVGRSAYGPFIAMELLEGRTLRSRLDEGGRLPVGEVEDLAVQIAEAMAVAHAKGIVHRDLKPANVMLLPDGRAKILDFGLAKPQASSAVEDSGGTTARTMTAEVTRESKILGTVAYMAPEQAEGKPVDSRADVFSFGSMLYELLAGKLPFQGDTPTATLAKVLESEPEPLTELRPDAPAALVRILQRCHRKRPDDRYNDTRDLVAELREAKGQPDTGSVAPIPPPARPRRWTPVRMALATLVTALVAVIVYFSLEGRDAEAPSATPSVAVLPFRNLSASEEDAYFAAGMTEEIITKLSRLQGLQVASRAAVAPYEGTDRNPKQIAEELGVRYLMEGSVRRAGDRVRITAQLVDSATGFQEWSEEFDGTLEDVFDMQSRTALQIAAQLDLQLTPDEQRVVRERGTDEPAAYDSYLRAQALIQDWSDREKLAAAKRHLEEALEVDPDYAVAMAGLASVEAQMYRNFDPAHERIQRALELAERASRLAPDQPRVLLAEGEIAGMLFDYKRAGRIFREVLELTPDDAFAWDLLSWVLAYQEPPDGQGAVDAAREAIRLQPNFPGAYYHLGRGLLKLGRDEEAREAFEHILELNPEFDAAYMGLAQYHLAVGAHQEALDALALSGPGTQMHEFYRACILADRGDVDAAFRSLDAAFRDGFRDFAVLEASGYLAELREDPRYGELVDRYRGPA